MSPFRATPVINTLRTASTSSVGLFPRPFAALSPAVTLCVQRQSFFLPALQQRLQSNFTSPSTRKHPSSSASSAIDEMIDADIDISDPPEAVGASHAATAKAARERQGREGDDMEGGNKMLYASAGALGLLGTYAIFKENPKTIPSGGISSSLKTPDITPSGGVSSSPFSSSASPRRTIANPDIAPSSGISSSPFSSSASPRRTKADLELDPGTDARGRTHPLSSVKQSRRQHDLPAHAPGGETIEFKLGRG